MKAAFNILPDKKENERFHLLIEAGDYGISFSWYTKDPLDIKGLSVFNFTGVPTAAEKANELENILGSNEIFNEINESVHICYDFKESILVPAAFYKPGTETDLLQLIHDTDNNSIIKSESIADKFNTYAVENKIESLLLNRFPDAKTHHSTTLQLQNGFPAGDQLFCIIFHNTIKVILSRDGALQIVQHFSYAGHTDVAYHLLNCCEQYNLKSTAVTLHLSGLVDTSSMLYNELYKYFLNIEFDKIPDGITLQERIKFYPLHYFSHLTTLISCVS